MTDKRTGWEEMVELCKPLDPDIDKYELRLRANIELPYLYSLQMGDIEIDVYQGLCDDKIYMFTAETIEKLEAAGISLQRKPGKLVDDDPKPDQEG